MRIEERCSCGGQIVIDPDSGYSLDAREAAELRAWERVESWRVAHVECRRRTRPPLTGREHARGKDTTND